MNSLFWSNLLTYCLQIGLLVALGSLLPPLLRLRMPAAKLAFWQLLLAACLLLPLVRPWRQQFVSIAVQTRAAATPVQPVSVIHHSSLPFTGFLPALLIGGILVRLGWLAAGFLRLRRYHRLSRPLGSAPAWCGAADLRISSEISSPVTFGFRQPVILLPAAFPELDAAVQHAILCHEILHVWRSDWLFTIGEELVRTAFWFHPAIWWLLGEIQLAREQAVDSLVIQMTDSRDQYLDALLAIAGAAPGATPQLDLVPAPLFLRKRHLKQRIFSILKEVRMSKLRTISTLAVSLAGLAAACWVVTGAFPLSAAPQSVADGSGVTVELNGAQLMHRSSVAYPREAIAAGVQGVVTVQLKLDATGNVTDASVLSGPDELRKSVLQSVLNWHFTKDLANTTRQVSVDFHLQPGAQSVAQMSAVLSPAFSRATATSTGSTRVSEINIVGLPEAASNELKSRLNVHVGDTLTPDTMNEVMRTARDFDQHLGVSARSNPSNEFAITISAPASGAAGVLGGVLSSASIGAPSAAAVQARPSAAPAGTVPVDGSVQSAKLISQTQPVYPPLALQARVQGIVELAAVIGADGRPVDLKVIKGHPLLIAAALAAVKDWVYQPTLLNGAPVAVSTTLEVSFTLNQ